MQIFKRTLSKILFVIAIICLVIAAILFFRYKQEDDRIDLQSDPSQPTVTDTTPTDMVSTETLPSIDENTETLPTEDFSSTEETTPPTEPEIPPLVPNPYAENYLANEDMVGWLVIPGTNIDYPVMWTPGDENYYLYRDFEKNDNANGCLILDTDSALNPLTTNLIIHGHNMKSGAMFGNLTDFEDEDYLKEHSQIILHTEECVHNYEIIAVFRSQVYKKKDEVFKFYKFFQANTEEEFNYFYENIKALSYCDTGVTAEFGDNFITLSTCVYHVENGRLVIVAKETAPGDFYLPIE